MAKNSGTDRPIAKSEHRLPTTDHRPPATDHRLPTVLLLLFVVAYAIAFAHLSFLRFDAFEARSLDLGNFDQAIWNTSQGRWFHLTNQPGIVNRLSLHVEPILIPISALYWIYSSPKTILLLQAIVVSLGAIPAYALAKSVLNNQWMALLFGISFLLNPSIQAANWLEFHGVTLAPTFLLAAFYYLYQASQRPQECTPNQASINKQTSRNNLKFIFFAVLAASCKEEIALLIFMMGLYAVAIQRRYRFGLTTMGLSLAWALFAVLGVQQFIGEGNIHWNRYGYLGDSPSQIVQTLITQPQIIIAQLQAADAGMYLLRHLIPVAFLALFAPLHLILGFPSLAINMLADFSPMHQFDELIYAAPIVPSVIIAGIFGLRRVLTFIYVRLTGYTSAQRISRVAVGGLLLATILVNHIGYGYTPGSGNYLSLQVTDHHRQAQTIIDQIPSAAKVSAQDRLNPHVTQRETVYIYPRVEDPNIGDADTIFVDVTGPAFPLHPNDLHAEVRQHMNNGFGVLAAQNGYLLLSRMAELSEIPPEFYTAWHIDSEEQSREFRPTDSSFGNLLQLTGFRVTTDRYGELVTELTWNLLTEHDRDLSFYIAYLGEDGQPLHTTEFYPLPATLWYPTSLWTGTQNPQNLVGNKPSSAGVSTADASTTGIFTTSNSAISDSNASDLTRVYKVQTLPWTLDKDQFTLAVGVFYANTGPEWATAERLPITLGETLYPLLEGGTVVRLGGYQETNHSWQPLADAAAPEVSLQTQFGGQLRLDGVTLKTPKVKAGEQIHAELTWSATQPIDRDYSLFVHLMSEQGQRIAQVDRQPADRAGFLPMTSWPVRGGVPWTVVDTVLLDIPQDTQPGRYQLIAGLYYWEDGQRLPANGPQVIKDDAVEIGWVEITQ